MSLSSQKFQNVVYTWAAMRVPEDKREQWEIDLDAPLPWQLNRGPTEAQLEREGQDFMAFLNAHKMGA